MDEEADLALLDQHLLKTNSLSQRMTGILTQLDTRLSRLDKTIAPLGLQPLTRKATNIDAILIALTPQNASSSSTSTAPPPSRPTARNHPSSSSTSTSASSSSRFPPSLSTNKLKGYSLEPPMTPIASMPPSAAGTPADETAILTRGPDLMALGEYFAAMDSVVGDLERMWRGLNEGRGGAREAGVKDLSKLVEIGFSGMTQLLLQVVKQGSAKAYDADHLLHSGAPAPPSYLPTLNPLLPLTAKMSTLLRPPPNSPLPKTESVVGPVFVDAMRELAAVRGEWMRKGLGGLVRRVEEVDEGGIWESGVAGRKVEALVGVWEVVLVLIEAETLLLTTLFPSAPPSTLPLPQTFALPLTLAKNTLTTTLNAIKKSLSTHTFLALELYQSLLPLSERWEQLVTRCLEMTSQSPSASSPDVRDLLSALVQPVSSLRGLCLRSFPEMLVDIRTARDAGTTSAISETTHSALSYVEGLPRYERTVEGLLGRSQSERSWLMGSREVPSRARSAAEEGGIVNLYVADVLGTLLIHLNGRAASMRKPIGQTFLLNNLSHIRNTTASLDSDIVGPGAEDMLNRAFRDAKEQYLAEWSHLLSPLTPSTPSSRLTSISTSERTQLKEAATAFFERLSELERACTENPLSRGDVELRERMGREVEGMVREGCDGFWRRCEGKGMEKYLRGSPEDVVWRVQAVFR